MAQHAELDLPAPSPVLPPSSVLQEESTQTGTCLDSDAPSAKTSRLVGNNTTLWLTCRGSCTSASLTSVPIATRTSLDWPGSWQGTVLLWSWVEEGQGGHFPTQPNHFELYKEGLTRETTLFVQGLLSGRHPESAEWSGNSCRHHRWHFHRFLHGSFVRRGEKPQPLEGPSLRVGHGTLLPAKKRGVDENLLVM